MKKEPELFVVGDLVQFVLRASEVETGTIKAVLKDGYVNIAYGVHAQLTATVSPRTIVKKLQ